MKWKNVLYQIEKSESAQPYLLRLLISEIRRSGRNSLREMLLFVSSNASVREGLSAYVHRVFAGKSVLYVLTESGISRNTGFSSEIIRRIKHSILPEIEPRQNINRAIGIIFPGRRDDKWFRQLPSAELEQLVDLLGIRVDFSSKTLQTELVEAMFILSHRIVATALETQFISTFKNQHLLDVFIQQNNEVNLLMEQHNNAASLNPELAATITSLLNNALENIHSLKIISRYQGASLQLSYTLHRLTRQIERLHVLLDFYQHPHLSTQLLVVLLKQLVENEKSKNRITRQLNETTYLLAYQIAEHKSKTGEHYIAETRKEYRHFFSASGKGGVIAVFMAFIKIILHNLHFAPFWQAFSYSINYAAGFVGIQVSHAILATKQPAMTASTIAKSLDQEDSNEASLQSLALTIGKVSRSQFISFAGNLLVVFPLAFGIAWLYWLGTGAPLVDEAQALQMLHDVHPWFNPTWYYACITGVFLFLSGIISGYHDNKVIYGKIHLRMRQHPVLKRLLGMRLLIRFTNYIENNLGSLIGNISLGFFLGMASFVGFIFGFPFDIRHITISSGNYAIAICTLLGKVDTLYALICLLGVMGIGFFNFLVSFGLALFVAAKSRRIKTSQFDDLLKWVYLYLKKHPTDFFFAPKKKRTIDDVFAPRK